MAGCRLGVPKSKFVGCSRDSGNHGFHSLAGMSEQEFDARLYERASTVPVIHPESTVMSEVPMVKKRPRRPNCVFRSIRSRIGIEVRSAIRIHSINRELNFFYCFLTRFFGAFHCRGIFPQGLSLRNPLCELCTSLSKIASAVVGISIRPCHLSTRNRLITIVLLCP